MATHPELIYPGIALPWGWAEVPVPPQRETHIVPTWDTKQHVFSLSCACRPVEDEDGDPIVYHNAFDGREDGKPAH